MKKGFTLMEILAVLLVIAVVVSMAVPVFRSVRYEVKNGQAKAAAKKMAEAMRSYYQVSRGLGVKQECFTPSTTAGNAVVMAAPSACVSPTSDGIPYQNSTTNNSSRSSLSQLFACGYLSFKDFSGLPYEFCACNPISGGAQPTKCQITETVGTNTPLVVVRGASGAGKKYTSSSYHIFVNQTMKPQDNAD
ncbi:prepilin-type N-terminal cleavage/methylation domain-containing protein [Candidatus Avelusimicrobium gallicola]|uniref:Type II secretion system protein GspG C-terminal domain-containing protein n=1 Tax=Candidatus Avelusimicrobium gallicola TaxID=2562704 RepID=A0A1Y4DCS7_9BACT|nr:prepilin-type N-terminal cleavage/methylation domain-containing protein [Elusimicrobium sp. An273]OUO56974.1 hypothetical protein B5F75_03765 [Elusimicrobium sp. An273]